MAAPLRRQHIAQKKSVKHIAAPAAFPPPDEADLPAAARAQKRIVVHQYPGANNFSNKTP
jgi:hypothetical protein